VISFVCQAQTVKHLQNIESSISQQQRFAAVRAAIAGATGEVNDLVWRVHCTSYFGDRVGHNTFAPGDSVSGALCMAIRQAI
jgi:hypothetical protein